MSKRVLETISRKKARVPGEKKNFWGAGKERMIKSGRAPW